MCIPAAGPAASMGCPAGHWSLSGPPARSHSTEQPTRNAGKEESFRTAAGFPASQLQGQRGQQRLSKSVQRQVCIQELTFLSTTVLTFWNPDCFKDMVATLLHLEEVVRNLLLSELLIRQNGQLGGEATESQTSLRPMSSKVAVWQNARIPQTI